MRVFRNRANVYDGESAYGNRGPFIHDCDRMTVFCGPWAQMGPRNWMGREGKKEI